MQLIKQTKPLQTLNTDQQSKSIVDLLSKDFLTTKAKDEVEKNIEQGINRDDLIIEHVIRKRVKYMTFKSLKR